MRRVPAQMPARVVELRKVLVQAPELAQAAAQRVQKALVVVQKALLKLPEQFA